MSKDLSIIYNAKLTEVKDSLEQLQELNFNTEKIESTIKNIAEKVELSVEDNYQNFDKVDSKIFLQESLSATYSSAISKLEKIKAVIDREYQAYVKINAKYKSLNNKVENVNAENIDDIASKGMVLLEEIRNSSVVDYKMEKSLVENIYKLIYKIIKLELIYRGSSRIVAKVLIDDTDCTYFAELVKENISELAEEDQETIKKIIIDLSAGGLTNQDYLNSSLLNTIITSEDNELTEVINNDFLEKIEEYEELKSKYELIEQRKNNLTEGNTELIEEKKRNGMRKMKKRIFLNINALVVATGILASGYVLKDATRTKEYKTITTTYNSITEEEKVKEGYQKSTDYSLEIKEYTPWIEPGYFRDGYEREVYKYDLSGLDETYPNITDYLTAALKDDVSFTTNTQTKDEEPKDLGYKENKYIIKEVKQDKNIYNREISPVNWILSISGVGAFIVLIDWLLACKLISKTKYSELKEDYKESKKRLKDNNVALLETKEELSNLVQQIINSREQTMKTYEGLPTPVKEMPKIKQKLKSLEDKNPNS